MMLWWARSASTTASSGVAETNAPSLWSGGIRWDGDAPEAGYWQTSANPTPRTGQPEVSIAVGGRWVNNVVMSASWSLGRSEWLGTLQPSSASLSVEGSVTWAPMEEVVIGVMSDVTDQHSASLWVGYVDTPSETNETSGRVTSSAACIDVIGRMGQSPEPPSGLPVWLSPTLASHIEYVAEAAGAPLRVVDDSVFASRVISISYGDEAALAIVNRLEQAENANVFLRPDGRLVVARRYYATDDLDDAPATADLSGASAPATWVTSLPPTTVVNDWEGFATSASQRTSQATYGRRSYAPEDSFGWSQLIDLSGGLMESPRRLLDPADIPITDLSHPALFLSPADWVALGGATYQVLMVSHSVQPGSQWRMSVTGDTTQPLLREAFE